MVVIFGENASADDEGDNLVEGLDRESSSEGGSFVAVAGVGGGRESESDGEMFILSVCVIEWRVASLMSRAGV